MVSVSLNKLVLPITVMAFALCSSCNNEGEKTATSDSTNSSATASTGEKKPRKGTDRGEIVGDAANQ